MWRRAIHSLRWPRTCSAWVQEEFYCRLWGCSFVSPEHTLMCSMRKSGFVVRQAKLDFGKASWGQSFVTLSPQFSLRHSPSLCSFQTGFLFLKFWHFYSSLSDVRFCSHICPSALIRIVSFWRSQSPVGVFGHAGHLRAAECTVWIPMQREGYSMFWWIQCGVLHKRGYIHSHCQSQHMQV